jgi:hypothetical protein
MTMNVSLREPNSGQKVCHTQTDCLLPRDVPGTPVSALTLGVIFFLAAAPRKRDVSLPLRNILRHYQPIGHPLLKVTDHPGLRGRD